MSGCIVIHPSEPSCGWCYSRDRALTPVPDDEYKRVECAACRQHRLNGLVKAYFPNGTAFAIFRDRCYDCRHHIPDPENGWPESSKASAPFSNCGWGVLDRIYLSWVFGNDHATHWHSPDDMDPEPCPPQCKRFCHRDEDDGRVNWPPPMDCPGQMTLGEADVPIETVRVLVSAAPRGQEGSGG